MTPADDISTGKGVPQAASPQDPRPQPVRVVLLISLSYLLLQLTRS